MFLKEDDISNGQAFITTEKCILFEVNNFPYPPGRVKIPSFYILCLLCELSKSPPATGLLLFIQEVLLDQTEEKQKKTVKYVVNAVIFN